MLQLLPQQTFLGREICVCDKAKKNLEVGVLQGVKEERNALPALNQNSVESPVSFLLYVYFQDSLAQSCVAGLVQERCEFTQSVRHQLDRNGWRNDDGERGPE